jgi:Glucodextranase, domain B
LKTYKWLVVIAMLAILILFQAACAASPNPRTSKVLKAVSPADQLSLIITSPADESVVDVNNIVISGQTAPEAVVSINGEVVDVDASGKFSAPVTLEEGPNVIDINATDPDGNEASAEIVVAYSPSI